MFRDLVRQDKKLSQEECIEILTKELRGVLSVIGDEGYPYSAPINHVYNEEDGCIYFHCGLKGHRVDSLNKDNKVCFCVYDEGYRNEGDWALNIKSVIVFGKMEMLTDPKTVTDISLNLSHKFTEDDEYIMKEIEACIDTTLILKLVPEHICGKLVNES